MSAPRDVLAAYERWARGEAVAGDWQSWAAELAAQVRWLLEATPASAAAPAGQATLSPADVLTVLGALRDGARWNDYPPGDPAAAARYRSLARSLGDDRG